MDSLTLKEKIGQLVQLDGRFFGAEEVPTGPCAERGIEPWVAENAGSVLNVLGAEKVYDVQKRHLEHSRIRLLFMADIVYGYITSYPLSLALACSWDMELVEECGKLTAYEASADGAHVTFSPMADARHTAQKWGFDGVVITDYATTHELIAHGVAENDADVGMDIDMQTSYYCQR